MAIAFLSGVSSLHAHHGQEFFLLYDAQVQKPMHGILQGNFSFIDEGTDDSIGLSPSLSLGILPRTAFNLRADFTDEAGDGWAYRSIEPGFQFDLTPPNLKLPVRFGLAVAYQFSEGGGSGSHSHGASDLSGGSVAHVHDGAAAGHSHAGSSGDAPHDHSTHYHPPAPVSSGSGGSVPDQGPDGLTAEELAAMEAENAAAQAAANAQQQAQAQAAAAAAARRAKAEQKAAAKAQRKAESSHDHSHAEEGGHSHSGSIHNHDDNLFTARLIFEADLTPNTLLVGNLISVLPEGGSAAWGYAVGVRHRFHPRFAMGIEALGDFDSKGHQEVLGAVFFEPMHHVLLKVGVGTGLTAVSPDATIRAGVLWMF
jgi:hypothetical protein